MERPSPPSPSLLPTSFGAAARTRLRTIQIVSASHLQPHTAYHITWDYPLDVASFDLRLSQHLSCSCFVTDRHIFLVADLIAIICPPR